MVGVLMVLALAACTKEQASDELGAVKKANEVAAQASAHANIAALEPLGIAECDSYLQKYETCLTGRVPAQQQQVYRVRLDAQRRAWERAAADPAGREALAKECTEATTLAKEAFVKFGCDF
jgi:hypothetical protein